MRYNTLFALAFISACSSSSKNGSETPTYLEEPRVESHADDVSVDRAMLKNPDGTVDFYTGRDARVLADKGADAIRTAKDMTRVHMHGRHLAEVDVRPNKVKSYDLSKVADIEIHIPISVNGKQLLKGDADTYGVVQVAKLGTGEYVSLYHVTKLRRSESGAIGHDTYSSGLLESDDVPVVEEFKPPMPGQPAK